MSVKAPLRDTVVGDDGKLSSSWQRFWDTQLVPTINTLLSSVSTLQIAASTPPASSVPEKLVSASATESPAKQQDRTVSEVSVSFTRDPADANFASVNIWFTGYKGNKNPTLMGSCTASPFSFLCETTRETVTVSFQPVGPNGDTAPLSEAITATVTLDGVVSAPPPPNVSQSVVSTPVGLQFSFNQVILSPGTEDVIDSYRIYRNTLNDPSSATLIQTIKHSPTNSGAVVVQDQIEQGQTRFYWVSAVNTAGLESTFSYAGTATSGAAAQGGAGQNLVFNGDFAILTAPTGKPSLYQSEPRIPLNPDGWTQGFEGSDAPQSGGDFSRAGVSALAYQRAIGALDGLPYPYGLVIQNAPGTDNNFAPVSDAFPVKPSAVYTFSAYLNTNAGVPANANFYFRVLWYQPGTTDFSRSSATLSAHALDDIIAGQTTSINAVVTKNLQAPSDAAYARIAFYHWESAGVTTQWNLVVSAVKCAPVSTSINVNSLNNQFTWVDVSNNILTGILSQSGATTTIVVQSGIYWSTGFGKIAYNGGSVDPGSLGTYYIYSIDVGYAGGSPTILATANFYDITSNDWVVLYGSITTAGGGGGTGGGGDGGGGDTCFSKNTELLGGKDFKHLRPGDLVTVQKADGTRVQRKVAKVLTREYAGAMLDMGAGQLVTPEHSILQDKTWRPAGGIFRVIRNFTGNVYNLEIETDQDDERNYVLANGYVAHNGCTL